MIRILIVDDHRLVGEGTKNMLESEQDFQVELVTSGTEAEQIIGQRTYDVYLLDWRMPDMNGIELSKRILQKQPNAKIVIYTGYDVAPFFNYLIESGVTGFISKTATRDQLITAIRCALRDEAVIPVHLLRQLRLCEVRAKIEENGKQAALSQLEQEILMEVANGLCNKDIAKKRHISQRSVERHLSHIFTKLHVSSRIEAVEKAKQLGLIPELHMLLTPSSNR
ncbi:MULTISPECIES: response regulator transcription factor [Bacillaceae]|jgi:two-component system, NarL family, competent response regulator ComA|uniref:response regulator transcription factor n=1 Tax=Anoxybacillaceae TaxID=3120669 RepID=UPI000BE47312|nr:MULTISPECIES: response regulator transcription factor [Bacillaceae]PDM39696.1 DNA-binding response regulator [Parageobacillus yumthangensis]RDV23142.1 DNA-binding response regulator [Parageobacillus toebii]TXK90247.1 response regulator transcription factor [Parageobacillus sp. SY1]PUF88710.1 DNA-binding response regulator [Geobacillus sp. LYN3]TXK84868.1 response regulator transcription factor [Geobacillus sp. AYS3]